MLKMLAISCAFVMASAAPSGAITIDFETDAAGATINAPAGFISTSPLTSLFSSQGVNFGGRGAILNQNGNFGVSNFSSSNFLAYNSGANFSSGAAVQVSDTITFTTSVTSASFFAAQGGNQLDNLVVNAFNSLSVLIATQVVGLQSDGTTVSFGGADIKSISYELQDGIGAFIVDDLNFSSPPSAVVPVPAALPLLLSGLVGLGFLGRRRKLAQLT